MKSIYIDYPQEMVFRTRKQFETNEERTIYLQQILRRNKVDSPSHAYSDYVVEHADISPRKELDDWEVWVVGS